MVQVRLLINNNYVIETKALFDTGAYQSCIIENLVPSQFFEKTKEVLRGADGAKLEVSFKLTNVQIQFSSVLIPNSFFLAKKLTNNVILGMSFIRQLIPYLTTEEGIIPQLLDSNALLSFYKPFKLINSILQENDKLNIQKNQQLDATQAC